MKDRNQQPGKTPVDLTNCDREPIHLAGAVQPSGALLAFELGDLTLQYMSQNIDQWLGFTPEVGAELDALFAPESTAALRRVVKGIREVVRPLKLRMANAADESHSAAAHLYRGMLLVEFEKPELDEPTPLAEDLSLPLQLTRANQRLQRCTELEQLYQVIADEMRHISGFDRVMLYRFAEDNHGEVIGESVVEGIDSFLGLHYPATDIPEQARRLYVLNTVRSIGDVNATPVPIMPACHADARHPLDLSLSCFRAVSPIHIEYLRNMGVQASMSVSIVIEGRLWGLIACHHYSAKPLRLEERAACEIMGLVIGNYLSAREQSEVNSARNRRRKHYHKILDLVTRTPAIWQALDMLGPELVKIVQSSGVAICSERGVQTFGSTPTPKGMARIIETLNDQLNSEDPVWSTHSLVESVPDYNDDSSVKSCGCLAVPLFAPEANWLLFFRDEFVSEVSWGGNPDKVAIETSDGIRLSPRLSFEEWKVTVHNQSRRWSQIDREMASELRSGLVELLSLRASELLRVNDELGKLNADLDSFAYAASHDLREPLRGINQTVYLLKHELGADLTDQIGQRLDTLGNLSSRMDELIQGLLKLSRAGQGNLEKEQVDLREVAEEASEMVVGRPIPRGIDVLVKNECTLWADYLCLRELLTNLIQNALKYNESDVKRVEIGSLEASSPHGQAENIYYVKDNGIGIAVDMVEEVFQIFRRLHLAEDYGGGSGAGLTICKKIVTRHGGKIWIESEPGTGSTVFFTLE
ncbi:ATP-binding protein [Bremerella cremea]|uniref:ATP-binding protein n=1 Tax=Bremerella cremea TaxID=1031537 RepID=UPI0031ED29C8